MGRAARQASCNGAQGPATPALSGRNSGSGGAAHSGDSSGNSAGGRGDAMAAALQETVHDSAAEKAARVKEKNRHIFLATISWQPQHVLAHA